MTTDEDRRVAIIGAGLIGRSWAMVFSAAGWSVRITDPDADALASTPALVSSGLRQLASHGLLKDPITAAARVSTTRDVAGAVESASFVQECGPESVALKREIFAELDAKAPLNAVIASSSSALYASQYTENLAGRHRCLVGHPVNPPHLIPVVEVCGARWTSAQTLAKAKHIYSDVGQVPVTIHKEVEGFVLNRLQGALLAEALRLVGEGVITPQDLDRTVKDGLGLRWSFMGPFETIDLNAPGGIADYCRRYTGFYRHISEHPPSPQVWDAENVSRVLAAWGEPLDAPARADRSAWRDRRLATLKAHKRTADAAE